MAVTLSDKHVKQFISDEEYTAIAPQIAAAHELLHSKKGLGNDFTGWVDLPVDYDKEEFDRIKKAAEKIKSNCYRYRRLISRRTRCDRISQISQL